MTQLQDGMMWALVKEKREEGIWMKRSRLCYQNSAGNFFFLVNIFLY